MRPTSSPSAAKWYLVKLLSVFVLLGVVLLTFVYTIVPHLPPPVDHEQIAREKIAQAAGTVWNIVEDWRHKSLDHSYPSFGTFTHLIRGKTEVPVCYYGKTGMWTPREYIQVTVIGDERQFIKIEGYDYWGKAFITLGNT